MFVDLVVTQQGLKLVGGGEGRRRLKRERLGGGLKSDSRLLIFPIAGSCRGEEGHREGAR